MTKPTVSKHWR